MKNIKKITLTLTILGITAIIYAFMSGSDDKEIALSQDIQSVSVRDMKSNVIATGIIKPQVGAEVKIGSRASGTVKNLYVNIGDFVKKGQLFAHD